jgi:hypothetical protein
MLTAIWKFLTARNLWWVVLWCLHVVLVIAVAIGLYVLNQRYHLESELLSPFPRLHRYWLPLLFLLVYVGGWLAWWFFLLLTDPRDGRYPDIDAAWAAGLRALDAAGIDIREAPLFVVIGKPHSGTADFFAATRAPFAVRAEPRTPGAPVQIYATREAVFVACEGASVLARLADAFAARKTEASVPAPADPLPALATTGYDLLDSPARPLEVIAGEPGPPAVMDDKTESSRAALEEWLPRPGVGDIPSVPRDEMERFAARLKYLCRLIAERRRPYCPANGLIWLLPFAGTESDAAADQTALAAHADQVAAEVGLQVYCPAAAVICDSQELVGFRDLLNGLPDALARERLLGRSFPLVPGVAPNERPGMLYAGIDWVARSMAPGVVYQRFGTEAEGGGERWSAANARLWRFTDELVRRRSAITRLIGQGIADGTDRPPMLAGAYLAGTGPDERDQAFAAGVIQHLLALQNNVAWTTAAIAEEADYARMTVVGYAAAIALVIAVTAFGYNSWR